MNRSEHPNSTYEAFMKTLLREIARCLGITYEQLTGDYVGATYSSTRMATADMWLINLYRRAHLPGRFYQTVFEAWLEEDIEKGNTSFPGGVAAYLAQKAQVARADWRGPPKPTADDEKTAKAQQIARAEGWMPTEQIAAMYENDHRDVIESQARTNELRQKNKLPPLPVVGGGGGDKQAGAGGGPTGNGSEQLSGNNSAGGTDTQAMSIIKDAELVSALMAKDTARIEAALVNHNFG
jgi:capsid protein